MTIKEAVSKGMMFVTNNDEIAEFITTTLNINDGTPDNYAYWFKIRPRSGREALVPVDVNGVCIDDEATTKMIAVKKEKKTVWIRIYKTDMTAQKTGLHCGLYLYETKEEANFKVADRDNYLGAHPIEVEI